MPNLTIQLKALVINGKYKYANLEKPLHSIASPKVITISNSWRSIVLFSQHWNLRCLNMCYKEVKTPDLLMEGQRDGSIIVKYGSLVLLNKTSS